MAKRARFAGAAASNSISQGQNHNQNDDDDSMEVDVEQPLVRLKTSDGKRFQLTKSQACCSNALRTMIESFQNNSNAPATEYINLQSVNSQMLSKIIEWTQWHGNGNGNTNTGDSRQQSHCGTGSSAQPSSSNGRDQSVQEDNATYLKESDGQYDLTDRDKAFLDSMSEIELFKLTHVANYLDIPTLFSACCQTIGRRWEGKKVAEIRRMYNIVGDFSQEEEKEMLAETRRFGMTD